MRQKQVQYYLGHFADTEDWLTMEPVVPWVFAIPYTHIMSVMLLDDIDDFLGCLEVALNSPTAVN